MFRALIPCTVVFLAATGCLSSIEERSASTTSLGLALGGRARNKATDASPASDGPICVMEVPGTGISVTDIEGGIAVTFDTVTPGQVGLLRRAVRGLQESYAAERVVNAEGHDHSARSQEIARRFRSLNGDLPTHETTVRDVARGARLELRASNAADVALLRRKMRAEIATMQRGVCPLVF
jgi:hypothetical protein